MMSLLIISPLFRCFLHIFAPRQALSPFIFFAIFASMLVFAELSMASIFAIDEMPRLLMLFDAISMPDALLSYRCR